MIKTTYASLLLALLASLGNSAMAQSSSAADIEKGRVTYMQNGCWQCHGFVGQGGVAGLKLAPDPKPFEYFEVFVRHTRVPMPPYSERILSKAELTSIHIYLKSIPKGPAAGSIELLK